MKGFRIVAALAALAVGGCGGGGGGGGGGGFTLTPAAAQLAAATGAAIPEPVRVRMHLTDNKTAYIGAGYVNVEIPSWLNYTFEVVGAADIDILLWPSTTGLPEGTYTTVLTLGTADEAGATLQTRNLPISYVLDTPVSILQEDTTTSFVFGHETTTSIFTMAVQTGAGDSFTVSSNAAWLTVPGGVLTGTQYVYGDVDVSGLAVGQYVATVTSQNTDDPTETDTVALTLNVLAPQLTVDTGSVLLGGTDGLSDAAASIGFALDTGARAHPWTATLTTTDGASWLLADSASGEVAQAGVDLGVDADRGAVAGGTYSGTVKIDVDVDGLALTASVPVTLNKEAERLYVMADGVAFAQFPSRELLTRDIRVVSTLGREGVAWSAASDQDWLAVTADGVTGESLTLTANPLLLATDTIHRATVTVQSSDPQIENTQAIRVGLWIGSADPAAVALPTGIIDMVMDPVAPLVYTHSGTNLVSVYNIYTGALAASYAAGTTTPGRLAISSDGLTLFVSNSTNFNAYGLAAADGTAGLTYIPTSPGSLTAADIIYARPDAVPTLFFNGTRYSADVASGEPFLATSGIGHNLVIAADSRVAWVSGGRQLLRRTALGEGGLRVEAPATYYPGGDDVALAPDGTRLYTATGHPYYFPAYDGTTGVLIENLAGDAYPNNAETAWNGVFGGGSSSYYGNVDLWFYDGAGVALGTARCYESLNNNWLAPETLRFSGDALRFACTADVYGAPRQTWVKDVPGS